MLQHYVCQKTGRQVNTHKYNGFQKMKMLLDGFIFSNFNISTVPHCHWRK